MSSSAYPIIWAMKHAPVADLYEKNILFALADHGDHDGCYCYPSLATIASIAMCDTETVKRKLRSLRTRGLIRPHQGPPPPRWLRLRKDRRPRAWELMIPFSFWSEVQREEIDKMRADRAPFDDVNSRPLTPEGRPDIAPAPTRGRKKRSDAGQPNPRRAPKRPVDNSDSEVLTSENTSGGSKKPPREDPGEIGHGGSKNLRTGALRISERGLSKSPNPPYRPSPGDPPPSVPDARAREKLPEDGRTDLAVSSDSAGPASPASAASLDLIRGLIPAGVLRNGDADRTRLAARVDLVRSWGFDTQAVRDATHGLESVSSAFAVFMDRTASPDRLREHLKHVQPAPPVETVTPASKDPWCGECTTQRQRFDDDGRPYRCPECHPLRKREPVF